MKSIYWRQSSQATRCFVLCGHECFSTEAGCDGSYEKKGRPKKDTRKLGIVDYIKQGVAKRRRKNPIAQETATKEVHEDTEQMRLFDELKSNQFGDSKDGLVGNA